MLTDKQKTSSNPEDLLVIKPPPTEIFSAFQSFNLESFNPALYPQAKEATEKLRQELKISWEFKKTRNILVSDEVSKLLSAVVKGDLEKVIELLKNGVSISSQDEEGKTVLEYAVLERKVDIVNYILMNVHDLDINQRDIFGRTVLHFACFRKQPEANLPETERALMMRICSLLVGDPRIEVDAKDKKGRTPLSVAARAGLNSVVDMLLRNRANPNLSTHVMRTPLHYACLSGYTGVVILLLEGGAWLEASDKSGFRAIHFAAHANNFEVVQVLHNYHCQLNAESFTGRTPYSLTTSLNIKWLIEGRWTSYTHHYSVDKVRHPNLKGVTLGLAMCPGRQQANWRRSLDMDLQVIISEEIKVVFCCLSVQELEELEIPLFAKIQEAGIEIIHFPITDKWVPSNTDIFIQNIELLCSKIQQGWNCLIHCDGGKGRTGLVATCLLMALDVPQNDALDCVQNVKQGMLQNPVQIIYVKSFLNSWIGYVKSKKKRISSGQTS